MHENLTQECAATTLVGVEDGLTIRQSRFIDELLISGNATRSYLRAGYSDSSTIDVAAANAAGLLKNYKVAAVLAERRAALASKVEVTQADVLRELARVAFSDLRDLVSWGAGGVEVKPSSELTDDVSGSVSEVVETRNRLGTTTRVKMHDKLAALRVLATYTGLIRESGDTYVDARSVNLHVDEAIAAILEARQRISEDAKAPPAAPVVIQGDD